MMIISNYKQFQNDSNRKKENKWQGVVPYDTIIFKYRLHQGDIIEFYVITCINRNIRGSTIACVAGVQKGSGREFGYTSARARETFRAALALLPRRKPPSFSTPATQAKLQNMCRKITSKPDLRF